MFVIRQISGEQILVASNRPPNPVSRIIQSTLSCSNQLSASIKVNSKKLLPRVSNVFKCADTQSATKDSGIKLVPILARSLKLKRCGEENTPTRKPISFIPEANRWADEPLPFVPAICTVEMDRPGYSKYDQSSFGFSSPIL